MKILIRLSRINIKKRLENIRVVKWTIIEVMRNWWIDWWIIMISYDVMINKWVIIRTIENELNKVKKTWIWKCKIYLI